jgi:hypothetical protein
MIEKIRSQPVWKRIIILCIMSLCLFVLVSQEQLESAYAMPLCSECDAAWSSCVQTCVANCGSSSECLGNCGNICRWEERYIERCFSRCVVVHETTTQRYCEQTTTGSGNCFCYQIFCCGAEQLCEPMSMYCAPCP